MMEYRLRNQLGDLEYRLREARRSRKLALCWASTAGMGIVLLAIHGVMRWNVAPVWWLALIGGIIAAWIISWREGAREADYRALVSTIARENPAVRTLLSTALEQQPSDDSGEFTYLQMRVIGEALDHPATSMWREKITEKAVSANNAKILAFAVLLVVAGFGSVGNMPRYHARHRQALETPRFWEELVVTPGDTEIERGSSLVVTARFGNRPPAEAALVLVSQSGKTQQMPLARNLADPIFGATLMEVKENALYRIEYAGKKSRDFKIRVFDYPALMRADAGLRFP